jgi:hypothetical protein
MAAVTEMRRKIARSRKHETNRGSFCHEDDSIFILRNVAKLILAYKLVAKTKGGT